MQRFCFRVHCSTLNINPPPHKEPMSIYSLQCQWIWYNMPPLRSYTVFMSTLSVVCPRLSAAKSSPLQHTLKSICQEHQTKIQTRVLHANQNHGNYWVPRQLLHPIALRLRDVGWTSYSFAAALPLGKWPFSFSGINRNSLSSCWD